MDPDQDFTEDTSEENPSARDRLLNKIPENLKERVFHENFEDASDMDSHILTEALLEDPLLPGTFWKWPGLRARSPWAAGPLEQQDPLDENMEADIPIWVTGQEVIKKTVNYKTTCGEVVRSVMGKNSDGWAVVERWKGVEKPLAPTTKILKVWNQWANDKDQVKLMIRRDCGKQRRRRSERTSIEKLLKLILSQGETIKTHLQQLASSKNDKVTESTDPETSCNNLEDTDGVQPEASTSNAKEEHENTQNVQEFIKFYEKISKINKKLEKQEELLVKLHVQLKRHAERDQSSITSKLEQMKIQNDSWCKELENNTTSLAKADAYIKDKTQVLQSLYKELNESNEEAAKLFEIRAKISSKPKDKELLSDADTNSDTGLSSLHSSSEEGTYVIESAL